jgi:hypothetical protein
MEFTAFEVYSDSGCESCSSTPAKEERTKEQNKHHKSSKSSSLSSLVLTTPACTMKLASTTQKTRANARKKLPIFAEKKYNSTEDQ